MIDISYAKTVNSSKITNHVKQPNVPSHLHNFDKANPSFLPSPSLPFLLVGETEFQKNASWGDE